MQAAQFRQFYGILPEPTLLLTASGVICAANPAARNLFCVPIQTGQTRVHELVEDPPDKVDRSLAQWQRTNELSPSALSLKGRGGGVNAFRAEGALITSDSDPEAVRLLLRVLPKLNTTERFLVLNERIEALNKEIAERQRTEAALARVNHELIRANADLEQFAYSASHDLREPLRMISIYSDLLKRTLQGRIDEKTNEFLSHMVQGAKRMEALIHDLLAYTQAVSLTTDSVVAVAADSVLDHALSNLRHAIDENQAIIHRASLPKLLVQPVHLLQLFQNVISNALKYRSYEVPKVSITARSEGSMCRISVHDNGIGIAPQYAEQVFGIFKRLHNAEKYTGTGVGLAICQKIVHRYGGRIWVESAGQGKGCTFHFTLPAATSDAARAGIVSAAD